jgi:hypothetical protein
MLTMLMAIGFSSAASAFSIEIDFYGGTTPLVQGDFDTGGEIILLPNLDWVMVDVVAADIPMGNGIAVFSWELNFDPSNMQISMLSTNYPGFPTVQEVDNSSGDVKLEVLSTDPQDGTQVLGTFRIDCTGVSIDQLFIDKLNDNNNLLADGTNFEDLYPDGVFATVNQVPIPAAAWLLGSGLLGLVAIRRKK